MTAGKEEHKVVVRDRRRIDPVTGAARPAEPEASDEPAEAEAAGQPAARPGDGPAEAELAAAELAAARAEAAERTADLKRITAEYANYRKRVDRDRAAVVEGATGAVLATLLPVLDDVERARAHGDLTGAFKAVADQLETALEKLGLQPFGAPGDAFDPMLHEAVAHQGSAEVTVPTCMVVLRRGFRHGDRLLRPALVTVADPAEEPPAVAEPVAPTDLPETPPAAGAVGSEAGSETDSEAGSKESATSAAATGPAGPPAAAWTPPASAPGGAAGATAGASGEATKAKPAKDAKPAGDGADAAVDEDDETPVAWFGGLGEEQPD